MPGLDGGDAVSEVLSTILMVVVVILLAAIVGSLVYGIWPPMEPSITIPVGGERNVHGSRRDGR